MKPCDCKDWNDVSELMENGIAFNERSLLVSPLNVIIKTYGCQMSIPMETFKRFAMWYLEDQEPE
jgi:hypothetical protein